MSFGAAIQGLAAGIAGAGQGLGQVRDSYQRDQRLAFDQHEQRALEEYRNRYTDLEQRRLEENRRTTQVSPSLSPSENAATVSARANDNPVSEPPKLRTNRALAVLAKMKEDMSDEQLDEIARKNQYPDFEAVVAAAQPEAPTSYRQSIGGAMSGARQPGAPQPGSFGPLAGGYRPSPQGALPPSPTPGGAGAPLTPDVLQSIRRR